VLEAGGASSASADQALATLCDTYWYPLYVYLRGRGHPADQAQDLTQAFFARLLEKQVVSAADPARGRFRSFLLGSLKNFLANEWDRETAQKRGGGRALLSLDFEAADERFTRDPGHHATPEKEFERNWALAVLERAMARLEKDYTGRGKVALFQRLRGSLIAGADDEPRKQMAADLGMSEGAVKVALHRMRAAFGEELRREIEETVGAQRDVDDELRVLIDALAKTDEREAR
jgi:RNA polymerase sigma-70 factor (ECF subfamily)